MRELSTSAVEFWALRSLGGEVLVPSRVEGGHPWLREHLRENYSAAWHEVQKSATPHFLVDKRIFIEGMPSDVPDTEPFMLKKHLAPLLLPGVAAVLAPLDAPAAAS